MNRRHVQHLLDRAEHPPCDRRDDLGGHFHDPALCRLRAAQHGLPHEPGWGVLFLHMVPKPFAMNAQVPGRLLLGFFNLHIFNRFVTPFVSERDPAAKTLHWACCPWWVLVCTLLWTGSFTRSPST